MSAVQAAASYSSRDGLLSTSAMNVPGVGAFEIVLIREGGAGGLTLGSVLRLRSAWPLEAKESVTLPSVFQNSDQTLLVPALAVVAPDGSVRYFDLKLRLLQGGAPLGVVVDSILDTAIGRTVAGPRGPRGPAGPAGADGSSGGYPRPGGSHRACGPCRCRGDHGPGGSRPGPVWLYLQQGAKVVAIEVDVSLDANGTLSAGIAHLPSISTITVAVAGDYEATFSISGVEPNLFAFFVNGALAVGSVHGSGAGTQRNRVSAILTLAARDVLTLRNHSSLAAVTLQTLAGGIQTNVNASVRLLKLN